MRLVVRVIEARGLPPTDADGTRDPYAKAQLGKQRAKTKVMRKTLCPAWDEEFAFRVGDLRDNLLVSVFHEDRYFAADVLGQVKLPLTAVLDADNRTLGTQWYQLQPKSKKSKLKDCGKDTPCHFSCFIYLHFIQFVIFVSRLVS
jgi:Ca2+-dependent lipid-binding protein